MPFRWRAYRADHAKEMTTAIASIVRNPRECGTGSRLGAAELACIPAALRARACTPTLLQTNTVRKSMRRAALALTMLALLGSLAAAQADGFAVFWKEFSAA